MNTLQKVVYEKLIGPDLKKSGCVLLYSSTSSIPPVKLMYRTVSFDNTFHFSAIGTRINGCKRSPPNQKRGLGGYNLVCAIRIHAVEK